MEQYNLLFALGLTLFAGLSTGIGSALAFFTKKTNTKFLSMALGFSAGVMIYVSFIDIIPEAKALFTQSGSSYVDLNVVLAFFGGIAFIFIIDMLIPSAENPHEMHMVEEMNTNDKKKLKRMGVAMALAIAIHNFPEGMATFASAIVSPDIAIPIAIAIAIHNIPEGIAVSVPIYYATGSKSKAFWYSLASGMSEPIGGLLGYFVLRHFITNFLLGILMAGIAGIMVFISVDELLPGAERYGKHHYSIAGFMAGMAVMAISLIFI